MPVIAVRIPQIGEGLQEARLVAVLKQPGEKIRRDEPIYQMETDKAVMDVESPYEGTLVGWLANVDDILPIGGAVAEMEVAEGVTETSAGHGPPATSTESASAPKTSAPNISGGPRRLDVPPRTRAYAKEKGLSDADLESIPAAASKLMPADIDAFLAGGTAASTSSSGEFTESALGQKQRLLASRLQRGSQLVVPGTIMVTVKWGEVEGLRAAYKAKGGDFQPSSFTMFAYAVARATAKFPAFRTTLVGDAVLRTYNSVHLGIAVGLEGDELILAVVDEASEMEWQEFAQATRSAIDRARQGQDQASEAVTLSLTNMQNFGLRDAVPVVVPPAVATLFLGEVYRGIDQSKEELTHTKLVNLALTFDHRTINGVGAANFINEIKNSVENIGSLIPAP